MGGLAIVVPTYWSGPGGVRGPGDAVYDHPNAVDGDNRDLERLLESLTQLEEQPKFILILIAVTSQDVAEAAELRVSATLASFPSLPTLQFGERDLRELRDRLAPLGLTDCEPYLRLQGYAGVRNLQLVVPHLLGCELVVALDDDEVVADPGYLRRARRGAGAVFDGVLAAGIGGFYLDASGTNKLQVSPQAAFSANVFHRKAAIMNACTDAIEARPGEIVPTNFVLGGNMTFTRPLFERIGFDPAITRGEDIDYLINARLEDLWFFLDKKLNIVHLPPGGASYKDISYSKLQQDVVRFIYEREKLRAAAAHPELESLTPEMLVPYPGDLLIDDLEQHALEALQDLRPSHDGEWAQPEEMVADAQHHAIVGVARYFEFREAWPRMMSVLAEDSGVRHQIERKLR